MTNDETDSTTAPTDELIDRREYMKAAGATAVTGLGIGAMATSAAAQETLTENQQTSYDGSFVSFWTDTDDTVSMTLEDGGSYSVDWQNTGNFVVGMGWDPGASRTIEYDATHNPSENSYLCIYGWTTDPLVEYYIIENYGTYRPATRNMVPTRATAARTTSRRPNASRSPLSKARRRSPSTGASARTPAPAAPSTLATTSMPGKATASSWAITTTRLWLSKPGTTRVQQCLCFVQRNQRRRWRWWRWWRR